MGSPVVGIVMGSDSDLGVMKEAAVVLEELGVPYEMDVVSAHRTPERASEYARTALERGVRVIIAGAGGAAHLAGVLAAHTTAMVIGVPVQSGALAGVDALYATVQMPPGVPVATVAVNGARNAGILAAEALATGWPELARKLATQRQEMAKAVDDKAARLRRDGFRAYLEGKK